MKVYIAIKETLIPYVFAKYEDAREVLQKQFEEDVKFRSHRGTIVEDTDSPINVYLEDYDEIHYSIVEKEVL